MKKYLPFALALTCACQTESTNDKDLEVVSQEVITSRMGNRKVYGVRFRATADEDKTQGFAIELARNADVWLDTVYLELSAGDTLESELIFSDAYVGGNESTKLKINSIAGK